MPFETFDKCLMEADSDETIYQINENNDAANYHPLQKKRDNFANFHKCDLFLSLFAIFSLLNEVFFAIPRYFRLTKSAFSLFYSLGRGFP